MSYPEFSNGVIFLNIILLFFLFIVYVVKLAHNKMKKKFLFGLIFMVIAFLVKSSLSLFYLPALAGDQFLILLAIESIAFAGLLFGELSDLNRYVKEYYGK